MSFDDFYTHETHERRITRCKACRQKIIFLATDTGPRMPIDADTVEADDTTFDSERHVSHFASCTDPDRFRKREA